MSWLNRKVSLYNCLADNVGRPATLREILLTQFGVHHDWYFRHYEQNRWISGTYNDLDTIIDLRTREMTKAEKLMLKQTLQCFTPAGLLATKKKDQIQVLERSGLTQLDFDYEAIKDYDIEELKRAVFELLPFVACCSLSCTGKGFFALIEISEPDKLEHYAEHCFEIFEKYSIPPDTTKGRNIQDLRFVSYDKNLLHTLRDETKPLKIKRFNAPKPQARIITHPKSYSSKAPIKWAVEQIALAQEGTRFETVRKVAYTLGGYGYGLDEIKQTINECSQFAGVESKYLNHAVEGFEAGRKKPIAC
jgi:hypothetical protein